MNEDRILDERNHLQTVKQIAKIGPLFISSRYKDTKDPCPVFDGKKYHIFGSGGDVRTEEWEILHALSDSILGPWEECDSVTLIGLQGKKVAAPGVIYDSINKMFHMFVQTDFTTPDSSIEYLTSKDGLVFTKIHTALSSSSLDNEIGLYDPHPVMIGQDKYLVYSSTSSPEEFFVPRPDIFLAKSLSTEWSGPWARLGKIVDHNDITQHHNRKDDPEYEWGIEGPQVVKLSSGIFLLNATCFVPKGVFGTRQRVFFATAQNIQGPYVTIGPIINQMEEWESGENGHAAILCQKEKLYLFYQARSKTQPSAIDNPWRYGIAIFE